MRRISFMWEGKCLFKYFCPRQADVSSLLQGPQSSRQSDSGFAIRLQQGRLQASGSLEFRHRLKLVVNVIVLRMIPCCMGWMCRQVARLGSGQDVWVLAGWR